MLVREVRLLEFYPTLYFLVSLSPRKFSPCFLYGQAGKILTTELACKTKSHAQGVVQKGLVKDFFV